MVKVIQYPHFLYMRTSAEATQDANGSWVTSGEDGWQLCGKCREEANGKGTQIQAASGEYLSFSSLIQIPKGATKIPEGVEVLVAATEVDPNELLNETYIQEAKAEGEIRVSGVCLKYDIGQLHNRLWV